MPGMDKGLKMERPAREEVGLQVKQGGVYTCSSMSFSEIH